MQWTESALVGVLEVEVELDSRMSSWTVGGRASNLKEHVGHDCDPLVSVALSKSVWIGPYQCYWASRAQSRTGAPQVVVPRVRSHGLILGCFRFGASCPGQRCSSSRASPYRARRQVLRGECSGIPQRCASVEHAKYLLGTVPPPYEDMVIIT